MSKPGGDAGLFDFRQGGVYRHGCGTMPPPE